MVRVSDHSSGVSGERASRRILQDNGHWDGRCCAFHSNAALPPSLSLRAY